MGKFDRNFFKAIPKSDLHVHLDGSLRLATLIELAKEQNIKLPSYTEEGLTETVFKKHYDDLPDYLQGFLYTAAVMQTPEALERIAYEFALDSFDDGVLYVEPRFAPQRLANPSLSMEDVFIYVDKGLARARGEINRQPAIARGEVPPFEYGIIGSAMRMFTRDFSGYYRRLLEIHRHMPEKDAYVLASLDLVRAMVHVRDSKAVPIVGFDLAGEEEGYPAEEHRRAYDLAHKHFLKKTVHAGEAYGPASIFQAIADCHADRIGHGTHIFDVDRVDLPTKEERARYVRALWEYVADRRITIEVCLTSNLQTIPNLTDIKKHPFGEMIEKRLSVTFCTDNRLVSNTSVTNEIELAVTNFPISPRKLKDLIIYGFKRSFYPADYVQKHSYVRKVIDYYERVENGTGVNGKREGLR